MLHCLIAHISSISTVRLLSTTGLTLLSRASSTFVYLTTSSCIAVSLCRFLRKLHTLFRRAPQPPHAYFALHQALSASVGLHFTPPSSWRSPSGVHTPPESDLQTQSPLSVHDTLSLVVEMRLALA